jgi:hypothetical protein
LLEDTQDNFYQLADTNPYRVEAARQDPAPRAHGSQIGLDTERELLAAWIRQSSINGFSQTKQSIATFLRRMLMLRREGGGVPLNTNEERLLDNENQKLSKDFIARLAADCDLTTGRIYNIEIACQHHFTWQVSTNERRGSGTSVGGRAS